MNTDIAQPGAYVRNKRTGQHYCVVARIGFDQTRNDDIVLSYTTGTSLRQFLKEYEAAVPGTYARGSLQGDPTPEWATPKSLTFDELKKELRKVRKHLEVAGERAREANAERAALQEHEQRVLSALAEFVKPEHCFTFDGSVFIRTNNGANSQFVFTEKKIEEGTT